MKITSEFIRSAVPNIDHPVLNSLHNSGGNTISVPVSLYKDNVCVFKADVSMLGTSMPQYGAALHFLLEKLDAEDISCDWDEVSFLSSSIKHKREEFENHDQDRLVNNIIADQDLSLTDLFQAANERMLDKGRTHEVSALREEIDIFADRLAAGLIRETASVSSTQIDAHINARPFYERARRFVGNLLK